MKKSHPDCSTKGSITVQSLDLNDLESVVKAATDIEKTLNGSPIGALVLNAGVISKTLARTAQGFEEGWGVNFVGHYVLTQKLLPLTDKDTHIVAVSSIAHLVTKRIVEDVNFEKRKFSGWQSYGQSKLAAILFMKYLARNSTLFKGKAYSIHPGAIATRLQSDTTWTKLSFKLFSAWTKTPQQGAATTMYACTDLCDAPSGSYLADCATVKQGWLVGKQAFDDANGDEMIANVEESLKSKFPKYFEINMDKRREQRMKPPMQVIRKGTGVTGVSATSVTSVTSKISDKVSRAASLAASFSSDEDQEHTSKSGANVRKDSIAAVYNL